MAKATGRAMLVKKNGTTIAAVRTKSINWQGTTIDVTTDDEAGNTTFLADAFASTSLELTVEGLGDGDVLPDLAFSAAHADKHMDDITLERLNGDEISGTFIMTAYSESGSHDDAVTFSATLVRSGIHTYTPAA